MILFCSALLLQDTEESVSQSKKKYEAEGCRHSYPVSYTYSILKVTDCIMTVYPTVASPVSPFNTRELGPQSRNVMMS
jgi:hypothetical protein